jgi:hypothetical protein
MSGTVTGIHESAAQHDTDYRSHVRPRIGASPVAGAPANGWWWWRFTSDDRRYTRRIAVFRD